MIAIEGDVGRKDGLTNIRISHVVVRLPAFDAPEDEAGQGTTETIPVEAASRPAEPIMEPVASAEEPKSDVPGPMPTPLPSTDAGLADFAARALRR
jgi:hypothetical protein